MARRVMRLLAIACLLGATARALILPPSPAFSQVPAPANDAISDDGSQATAPFDTAAGWEPPGSDSICVEPPEETNLYEAFYAGYDRGFVIAPFDPQETPFSLKFNLQNQVRYVGFARGVDTWTDSAGNVRNVTNRNALELPRGRAIFSGTALLPEVSYYLNIDYNTVSSSQINFRGYWLAYRFGREATVYIGQNKVPGSREWLESSLNTLGPDRSLATTFFRPSLSQGIWAIGELEENFHYHAMIANGFNTNGASPEELDTHFAYSASIWWEPWGAFGLAYSDLEWHDDPAIRIGGSATYSPQQGRQEDPNFPENAEIRLSDGTLITETGAFAPGATVQSFNVMLGAIDLGWKHRGISLTGELYLREIFELRADLLLPRNSMFDFGGFGQMGVFIVPREWEAYARISRVTGPYGTGAEYAGGINWFILPGSQDFRITLDTAWISHSPADQNRTDYRAGDTGLLVRMQVQTFF
ncbi:MAG: porin [Planctomycetaceae bacterium]